MKLTTLSLALVVFCLLFLPLATHAAPPVRTQPACSVSVILYYDDNGDGMYGFTDTPATGIGVRFIVPKLGVARLVTNVDGAASTPAYCGTTVKVQHPAGQTAIVANPVPATTDIPILR